MNKTLQITYAAFRETDHSQLFPRNRPDHPPRVLLLDGSLRKRSFTLLTRGCADYLVDRYSERLETGKELIERVAQTK